LNIPLQKTSEIIEHVGAERKCKAVDIRFAFAGRQDRYDRNGSFENDRDDEHRDVTLADDVGTFHKIGGMSATPALRLQRRSGLAGVPLAALKIASILPAPSAGRPR
jgi:hypothetical protein